MNLETIDKELLDKEQALTNCLKMPVNTHSIWRHTNGNTYEVLMHTNIETKDPVRYPTTVVYRNTKNNAMYSRPISDWHRSMTLVYDYPSNDSPIFKMTDNGTSETESNELFQKEST